MNRYLLTLKSGETITAIQDRDHWIADEDLYDPETMVAPPEEPRVILPEEISQYSPITSPGR
ncbi:hypothetical protein [Synechococcus phage Ssp-JY39]